MHDIEYCPFQNIPLPSIDFSSSVLWILKPEFFGSSSFIQAG